LEPSKPTGSSSDTSYQWVYVAALLVAMAVFVFGSYLASHHGGFELLAAGIISLLAVLVTWPIAASLAATRKAADQERVVIVHTMTDRLQQIAQLLTTLSEQQLLSDRAKSVAFREKDRQALRSAIREEMNAKDWDAALVLANEMETQFGYKQEAAILRSEINNNRSEVVARQIADAAAVVEEHIRLERWSPAMREAEQIIQIYPNDERALRLPQEIENKRQAHKRQLLDSWKDSVSRNDVDGSIEILKKVDPYLTPAEAASMQETARGIFRERLNQLRDRFAKAVHDENWSEALRLGEMIMAEHPNSRLALEVRDTMETLRQRAGKHAEVA
jgi:tetratricopeptide (TPR) repeat protein